MTWKDRLQDASFRGVPFKVEEESAGTGRRVETHEYVRWEGVSDGLKVTAGSVIQRDDLVQYTATADATSSGGVLRVPITCSTIRREN